MSRIQDKANKFNKAYMQAMESSNPNDWHAAASLARQLVNELEAENVVTDNLPHLMENSYE